LAFNRTTSIGSASARILIDLSQVEQSAVQFRSLAQQITQSVQQIQSAQVSTGGGGQSNTRAQESQQRLQTEQKITDEARKQFQIAQSTIAQLRTAVAEQANLFRTATAGAPSSVQRGGTEQQLRAARQPIVELQRELARLRTAYLQATTPEARNALIPELQRITTEARNAANGIQPLVNSVAQFQQQAQQAGSGLSGVFNRMQQGLARITEVGLAAQLQEISFRLLPLTAGMGLLAQRGIQTAQGIEEASISFRAFTGSAEEAQEIMNRLRQQAQRFGQPFIETLGVMQRFAPLIRQAGLELDDVFNLAVRLATLNPAQGIEGALFAINEALAGQWRSLQTRFNIPTTQLREMINQEGFVGGLDQFLNQLGRTTEFAEEFGDTSRAAFTRLQDSVDRFLSGSMNQFLDGMRDGANFASNLFDSLAEGPQIIQQLVGGFLTLGTAASAALISIGQIALAISSIRTVTGAMNIGAFLSQNLPTQIVSAFVAAKAGMAAAVGTAVSVGISVGVLAIAATVGALIGGEIVRFIANHIQIGSPEYTQRLQEDPLGTVFDNFKQLLFIAITKIAEPLFEGASILQAIFAHFGDILNGIGSFFGDILSHIGAFIQNTIGSIEQSIGTVLLELANALSGIMDTSGIRQAGISTLTTGTNRRIGAAGTLSAPIAGIGERIPDLDLDLWMQAGREAFRQAMLGVREFLFPETGTGVPADGGLTLGGGGMGITPEQLEEIRALWSQIQQQQREFALQEQRIMQDRVIAAQREAEDFAISQARSMDNFNLQQIRSMEDFQRNRAQSIEDFERQMAESEAQTREQRAKKEIDFQKQMLRAQEDHLRNMVRMSRDVENAISARNFLDAQNQLQRMRDAEEDFGIEQQRRREDFAQQIAELEENLKVQQDKRREDFQRQLARQEENFNLQRQRQVADFERQRQLEEQDRQRRLQRQAQDYALQDQRRLEDFNRRIQQMLTHNSAMQALWENGLSNLRTTTQNFFNGLSPIIQSLLSKIVGSNTGGGGVGSGIGSIIGGIGSGIGSIIGGIGSSLFPGVISTPGSILGLPPVTGYQPGSGYGGGGSFPITTPTFDVGSWYVPRTMGAQVHEGEIITPEPFASAVRRGDAVISGRGAGGDTYQISVPLQVINAQNMDENQLAERVAGKINQKLEERRRGVQPRRGFS
jgi:hypothetical protein